MLNSPEYILLDLRLRIQSGHLSLWWQLCTLLAFSHSASWGSHLERFSIKSWKSFQTCWVLSGCFSFTLCSNASQTISIGFRSGDCGSQVVWLWCGTLSLSFLEKLILHNLHVCFGFLFCWKTNDLKPDGMMCHCKNAVQWCCMSLILSPPPNIITFPLLCFTAGHFFGSQMLSSFIFVICIMLVFC